MTENSNKKLVQLSILDPEYSSNLTTPTESKIRGKDYIGWGEHNDYPDYLYDLYQNVATLQSIVNGTSDFVCGNDIKLNWNNGIVNKTGETAMELIKKLIADKLIFGGYAIQVIRDMLGRVCELYHMDFMKIRSDKKNEVLYYCDDWSQWGAKAIAYPKFSPDDTNATSVLYCKGSLTRSVYPTPVYGASIIACELEKAINEFHLNNINNGFMSNLIINFNNGQPNDEQKKEIENGINEKFSGHQNAGRILISYNDSDENKTTIERLNDDNFDEKYQALAERSRQQIFTAFRATPNLFGDPTSTTGFNEQEYESSFKLYNRTVVRPLQNELIDSFDRILGIKGSLEIAPFTLDGLNEKTVE